MTERPDHIASLYSRARGERTRYWDFSASRTQVRGQFRHPTVREPAEGSAAITRQLEPPVHQREVQAPEIYAPQLVPPREEAMTRWYALGAVFASAEVALEPPVSLEEGPPTTVVFSLAGGVGKTCLVATLGRALSAQGEYVLLADAAASGLLPFYFGSRELRPALVRTFSPPGTKGEAPVQVLNLQPERYPQYSEEHDPLPGELVREGRGATRILVDVATASRELTSRLLPLRPTVLVPVLADMSSLASLPLLEALFAPGETLYLLNQFDDSSPLHLDVRALLHRQLGDRLLPFVLRRSPEVSEALAEGMTVIDYAPNSAAAEDYRRLASWLHSFAAPAKAEYVGARWTER